jgi:UDP-2,3-diacylglucosamine hydrolase
MEKLGLIAGAGTLPVEIAERCEEAGRSLFIVRLKGADEALGEYPGVEAGIGQLGKVIRALKAARCQAVCMIGKVQRPNLAALIPDAGGLRYWPGLIAAGFKGDDGLLREVSRIFESQGFRVEGPQEVAGDLTLPSGPLGSVEPREGDWADIAKALAVARELGKLDVGQGAVVARGLVLAVEAQEGTDAMLERCASLRPDLRGAPGDPAGVLAKAPKPIQDRRLDLPVVGVDTVLKAAHAGLAGIVGETGGVLVANREQVIAHADALGLFVVGVDPLEP